MKDTPEKIYTTISIRKPEALEFSKLVAEMRARYGKTTKEFSQTDGLKELINTYRKEVMK